MKRDIVDILGVNGKVDSKAAEFLSTALSESGKPGFDYLKFRQSVGAMAALELDEPTAYKSAFATAQTMAVTKDGLAKSARHYLSVLMNEKRKFDEALNKRVAQHVASKKSEVQKLQEHIEKMKVKIKELEQKMAEYQNKINTADEDVAKEKIKIEDTQSKFESTFNAFVEEIESDITRIEKYLS